MTDVHKVTVQVRAPKGTFPGDNNFVTAINDPLPRSPEP
jgi:hypothetical protein